MTETQRNNRQTEIIKIASVINKSHFEAEPYLHGTKFADYAFISPVEATHIFRREYTEMYQEYYGRYEDIATADKKLGMKRADLFRNPGATITALWKARQSADILGVRYDFYCRNAFENAFNRHYKKLPLPNQIYSDHMRTFIELKWKERSEDPDLSSIRTTDPRFKTENYNGDPAQDNYNDYQLQVARSRVKIGSYNFLTAVCFRDETLPPDVIETKFGLDRRLVDSGRRGPTTLFRDVDLSDFRRSCFGLPYLAQGTNENCLSCEMKASCIKESLAVTQTLIENTGSENPFSDKARAKATDRKRRQREREKLTAAARA